MEDFEDYKRYIVFNLYALYLLSQTNQNEDNENENNKITTLVNKLKDDFNFKRYIEKIHQTNIVFHIFTCNKIIVKFEINY